MPSRGVVVAYGAWFVALAVVFLTVRPLQVGAVAAAGLTGAGAIVAGIRRHRPPRRWPWRLLATSLVLSTAGQVIFQVLPGPVSHYGPGSLLLAAVLIAMSACAITGIVGLARSAPRDLSAVVDVTILLLGTGLLAGVLVAIPFAMTPGLPGIQAAIGVFFVARDVALLAAFLHFSTSDRWNGATLLLVGGAGSLLAYDFIFSRELVSGVVPSATWVELCWLLFAGAWGLAALLPAMRDLGERGAEAARSIPLRLGLLAVAAILPVGLLTLATYSSTRRWYEPLIATVSAVMLALVLAQLLAVALRLRHQVHGEQALSHAVAQVAAANDAAGVAAALESGVPRLGGGRAAVVAAVELQPTQDQAVRRLGPGPVTAVPLCDGDHPVLYLRGTRTALDQLWPRLDVLATQACLVLERIRLNAELVRQTTADYLNAVAQTTGDALLLVDDEERITLASRSAGQVFGRADLVGARLPELFDEAVREPVATLLQRARRADLPADDRRVVGVDRETRQDVTPPEHVSVDKQSEYGTFRIHRSDGTEAELEVACRPLTSPDPGLRGLLVNARDVTEQRRLEQELTERSAHDPLTGLATGLGIRQRVQQDMQAHPGTPIALIVIDLNDFKLVNNQFGHDIGDQVLRTIADRLTRQVPPGGLVGRASGDRFAVVHGVAQPADADSAAARLLSAIAQPIPYDHGTITCTANAGIATTADTDRPAELVRQADLALLVAQDHGRGGWYHYDPTAHSTVIEQLELREALAHALDQHTLTLQYQPIVDLHTGAVTGFEALIRWQHPAYQHLSPEKYLRVAEESNLIIPIGDWALTTALRDTQQWDGADPAPFVSVNVTATQVGSPGYCDTVLAKLAASGLPAARLHLEITESSLLNNEASWVGLQRLRSAGIHIAIDDFGTGYSALSYLGRVPVDHIKLDHHFIASMRTDHTQRELVAGIVTLTRILRLDVIAEGVETPQDRELAAEAGCRFGQGYLFAHPMPNREVNAWLAHAQPRSEAGVAGPAR